MVDGALGKWGVGFGENPFPGVHIDPADVYTLAPISTPYYVAPSGYSSKTVIKGPYGRTVVKSNVWFH